MPVFGGGKFWLNDPRPEDFDIGVVAHSSSMICRFNGHVSKHYSVAQHSVLCSYQCDNEEEALEMLFHDGEEPYTGDIITPFKRLFIPNYHTIQDKILKAMGQKFGFVWKGMSPKMEEIDRRMLVTEVYSLIPKRMRKNWEGYLTHKAYDFKIKPWSSKKAKNEFLNRYWELTHGRNISITLRSPISQCG